MSLRTQAVIHQSRNVHPLAITRVHHRCHHWWDRQSAWRRAWLDLRRHGRSMLDAVERRLPADGRRARPGTGRLGERRKLDRGDAGKAGRCRRTQGRNLRHHHHAVHYLRALWALRAVAENAALFPIVSALQEGNVPAAEDLRQIGAQPVSCLRVENLALRFGGLTAVDQVSFEVRRGEVFTMIGPNGAGKTSIFNMISRFYQPSAGRIYFEDADITDVPPHAISRLGIARTFQNIELFEKATVLATLLAGRHKYSPT